MKRKFMNNFIQNVFFSDDRVMTYDCIDNES